ncbi:hypothetical protein ACOMHN_018082 [Nucella lapillus]
MPCLCRQQLQDLDSITTRLRLRLSVEESDIDNNQPSSARSADILTGTHSGLSTIHTTSSLTVTRDVLSDVSRQLLTSREITANSSTHPPNESAASEDLSSHNAVDSGAFSGNNTGKSQDGPDSQRSEKQVAFGEGKGSGGKLMSALPPSGNLATAVEEQFLEGSPQGALTPRDFSSNSQTSQGFQPAGAAVPSESSGSGVVGPRAQKVPSLTNLTGGRQEEEVTPRAQQTTETHQRVEDLFQQDYPPPADYNSEENSNDDEMFGSYHHYRAMLDQQEHRREEEEEEEEEGSNVELITPRRINDVSGILRQFDHPSGTLPHAFPPHEQVSSSGEAALHTWPGVTTPREDHNTDSVEKYNTRGRSEEMDQKEFSAEEEEEREEEVAMGTGERSEAYERNSFIDSWLEDSRDRVHTPLTQSQALSCSLPQPGPDNNPPSLHPLDLEARASEASSEGDTPRVNGAADLESLGSEKKEGGSVHLLSRVELIDTLTSVNSAAPRQKHRGGNAQVMVNSHLEPHYAEPHAGHDGHLLHGQVAQGRHLLSNVELYSTVSSYHPAASQRPRHLLSNVELASTASGSSHHPDTPSSRPSRQSSATSAGRRAELEVCAEHSENEGDSDRVQPISARSDEVSQFFAPQQQGVVMNGAYDSSEEELDYQYSAAARAGGSAKPRGSAKGREPCQSITATTEDSGLESGAKSSQDEREALSLLDSTQGHGFSGAAATAPAFFLPADQLQASMRALQLATSAGAAHESVSQKTTNNGKAQASADLLQRLKKAGTTSNKFKATMSARGRQLPTAEEAKRIAKIFSTKPS